MVSLKSKIILVTAAILLLLASCQEKVFTGAVNCEDCYTEKPDSVDLLIHLTLHNDTVPVLIFEGTIDKGQLIDTFYCFGTPTSIWVKAEVEYAAKAIYQSTDRTVYVVDGKRQKLKRVSDNCDEICWVIEDTDMYLELNY